MLLFVGLGNPGADYAGNRHNIGFMAVDAIVRRHGFSPWRAKFHGAVCEGTIAGEKVVALKPATYMNDSGRAVVACTGFYKIEPKDVIVFHDELDLAPGRLRVKIGGGHAGHNGLRSIQAHIGPDFRRIRLGIGHPGAKERVTGHVLGDFAKVDREWLEPLLDDVAAAVDKLVAGDDTGFMNAVASPPRPLEAPAAPARAAAPSGEGPPASARNAMAETLRRLLAAKKR
ncbi:aminoacyl-tRNA hydrolase [Siculibacillus lacustris]|uniref:Peptidyl-tRNA hydrolase n=1 Tax=Siculibacillus lacustris TaxID=1549641 RepID=A0A4Q9VJW5_9HYPH|nr:aminoacyl-tRNA hydrolase [Siculibacillus lacustris]TBW34748.1 aminoacyl-tRNA hydrolase [Siculibacillus lacustris]